MPVCFLKYCIISHFITHNGYHCILRHVVVGLSTVGWLYIFLFALIIMNFSRSDFVQKNKKSNCMFDLTEAMYLDITFHFSERLLTIEPSRIYNTPGNVTNRMLSINWSKRYASETDFKPHTIMVKPP